MPGDSGGGGDATETVESLHAADPYGAHAPTDQIGVAHAPTDQIGVAHAPTDQIGVAHAPTDPFNAARGLSEELTAQAVPEALAASVSITDQLRLLQVTPPADKASVQAVPKAAPANLTITDQLVALQRTPPAAAQVRAPRGVPAPRDPGTPVQTVPERPRSEVPISTAPSGLPPPRTTEIATSGPQPACPQCEAPMAWVDEHLRFYCKQCRMYF